MNAAWVATGAVLITMGVVPTPDDVTVISPVIQIVGGTALIIAGLVMKEPKGKK